MKNKKKFIIIGVIVLLLIIGGIIVFEIYSHSNQLTITEKKWLDDKNRSNAVININVLNNSDVFGNNGSGVFYDFLKDFKKEYSLNLNEVAYNYGTSKDGATLGIKTNLTDNDMVFYTDHYVLVSKDFKTIKDLSDVSGKTVGILSSDMAYVTSFISSGGITFASYDKWEDLFKSLIAQKEENKDENKDENKETTKTCDYILVPLHLYLSNIVKNNYKIVYHLSDINIYYVFSNDNGAFSSILKKYYAKWSKKFDDYYNDELFNLITSSMNIKSADIDAIRSVTYNYGYLNNSPYEVISGGNYGGIAAVYLKGFMDFADVDFSFTKYGNINKFNKAIGKDKVDIYFGYYDIENSFVKTDIGIPASYVVVANNKNDVVVSSINSLANKTVYVDKNSYLNKFLSNNEKINIRTYSTAKELLKLNKKDEIIIMDKNIYDYYHTHGLENYSVRFSGTLDMVYGFNIKGNEELYKLLSEYMSIVDAKKVINKGIYNHEKTIKSGRLLGLVARYFIYLLVVLIVIGIIIIRKTKKITIAKKIKKEDKMRFIDQLTLLKNRNYLSENLSKWGNNTIYPQTIIVLDLNHLSEINDTKGYEEGDKQIKAAANVLIKTQLDNSDIIRTDGNEFVIYLVGYSQKQITNYIHKLNKEFKKLPYNYGAEFGYSMIIDDIKTIEDALNEATKDLKEQKGSNEKKD